jgi:hypothetical protein
MKDMEGSVHTLIQGTLMEIAWGGLNKTTKIYNRIVGVPAEIRNRHLPNASQHRYGLCQLARSQSMILSICVRQHISPIYTIRQQYSFVLLFTLLDKTREDSELDFSKHILSVTL